MLYTNWYENIRGPSTPAHLGWKWRKTSASKCYGQNAVSGFYSELVGVELIYKMMRVVDAVFSAWVQNLSVHTKYTETKEPSSNLNVISSKVHILSNDIWQF